MHHGYDDDSSGGGHGALGEGYFMEDLGRIAAIIPCHNEAGAIAKVVEELRAAVPSMDIYVYDNVSTDDTAAAARAAGAHVRTEERKGKGNVIRRAFADIDADIYVLIDGDDTYDAGAVTDLIDALVEGPADHVTGVRRATVTSAYRPAHEAGNRFFNLVVARIFRYPVTDMLSGYRVFSRRYVKSFPAVSPAFEIETEMTIHVVNTRMPQREVPVAFKDRAEGTESKLRTYSDGGKILRMIMRLIYHERPLALAFVLAAFLLTLSGVLMIPVAIDYVATGLVPRFPSLIVAAALLMVSVVLVLMGMLLEGLTQVRSENARAVYLSYPPPPFRSAPSKPTAGATDTAPTLQEP